MDEHPRPRAYYFINWLLRILIRVFLDLDLHGTENVPRTGPVIIAISHSSFIDPVIAGPCIPREVTPMAKAEAFNYPVLGWVLRAYGAFPVRRGEADISAFKMALTILRRNSTIVIAPEGHRSETGKLQRGREGAIMLSVRSGAPIQPVAVWGGKGFWSNLAHLRRTQVHWYIGQPVIPAVQKPTREQMAEMSDELMMRIAEMMPPEIRGYYADKEITTHTLQPYVPAQTAAPSIRQPKEVIAR